MGQLIIVDTREKKEAITDIISSFQTCGYEYERSKLLFGDYIEYSNPLLVIDRKQNIQELAQCCASDHERFRRELDRVKKVGAHLVILVEQNHYQDRDKVFRVDTIEDLMCWSSPHTQVRGEKVYRVLASWMAKYPISVRFCSKKDTGKEIIRILYGQQEKGHRD